MKLNKKNKQKSYIHDWHNRTESTLFGGVRVGVNSEKWENWGIFNLRMGDQILMEFYI